MRLWSWKQYFSCIFMQVCIGRARNLKLTRQRGARARAHGGSTFFSCMGSVVLLFSCCVRQKDVVGSRGRAPGQRSGGEAPLKLKHLAFGHAMEATNLLAFKYLETQKKSQISDPCCVAKMMFNKSHLGMIKCQEGTLSASKFFLGPLCLPLWCC